jgi:hypothetical protein
MPQEDQLRGGLPLGWLGSYALSLVTAKGRESEETQKGICHIENYRIWMDCQLAYSEEQILSRFLLLSPQGALRI